MICAEWHALAKLRMHTETTLQMLEDITIALGVEFRRFDREVCSNIQTEELKGEVEARVRREQKKAEKDAKKVERDLKKQLKETEKAEKDARKAEKGAHKAGGKDAQKARKGAQVTLIASTVSFVPKSLFV